MEPPYSTSHPSLVTIFRRKVRLSTPEDLRRAGSRSWGRRRRRTGGTSSKRCSRKRASMAPKPSIRPLPVSTKLKLITKFAGRGGGVGVECLPTDVEVPGAIPGGADSISVFTFILLYLCVFFLFWQHTWMLFSLSFPVQLA